MASEHRPSRWWLILAWLPIALIEAFSLGYLIYARISIASGEQVSLWVAVFNSLVVGSAFVVVACVLLRSWPYTVQTVLAISLTWSATLTVACFSVAKNILAGLLFLKVFAIILILVVVSLPHLKFSIQLLRISARYLLHSNALLAILFFLSIVTTGLLTLPTWAALVSIRHFNHPEIPTNLSTDLSWNVFMIVLLVALAVFVFCVTRYLVHYAAAYSFARQLSSPSTFLASSSSSPSTDDVSVFESSSLINKHNRSSRPTSPAPSLSSSSSSESSSDAIEGASFLDALAATFGFGFRTVSAASIVMLPNSSLQHYFHRMMLCSRSIFQPLYLNRLKAYSVYGVAVDAASPLFSSISASSSSSPDAESQRDDQSLHLLSQQPGDLSLNQASIQGYHLLEKTNQTGLAERSVVTSLLFVFALTIAIFVGGICQIVSNGIIRASEFEPTAVWFPIVIGSLFALLTLVSLFEALEAGTVVLTLLIAKDPQGLSALPKQQDRDEIRPVLMNN